MIPQGQLPDKILLSRYYNHTDKDGLKFEITPQDLIALLTKKIRQSNCTKDEGLRKCLRKECPHKNGPAIVLGDFQGRRLNENILTTTALTYDLDGYTDPQLFALIERLDTAGLWYVISGTHNDGEQLKTDLGNRYLRCVVLPSRLVPVAYHRALYHYIAVELFGGIYDPSCANPARLFYLPSVSRDRTHYSISNDGSSIDIDALIPLLKEEKGIPKCVVPLQKIKYANDDENLSLEEDCKALATTTAGSRNNKLFKVAAHHGYNQDAHDLIFQSAKACFNGEQSDAWIRQTITRISRNYSRLIPIEILEQLPNANKAQCDLDSARPELMALIEGYANRDEDKLGVALLAFCVGCGKTHAAIVLSKKKRVVLAVPDHDLARSVRDDALRLGVPFQRFYPPTAEKGLLLDDGTSGCEWFKKQPDQIKAEQEKCFGSRGVCAICPMAYSMNCRSRSGFEGAENANLRICTHDYLMTKDFLKRTDVLIVDELGEVEKTTDVSREDLAQLASDAGYIENGTILKEVAAELVRFYDSGEDTFKTNKDAIREAFSPQEGYKVRTSTLTSYADKDRAKVRGASFLRQYAFSEVSEIKAEKGKLFFKDTSPAVKALRYHQFRGGVCIILNASADEALKQKLESRGLGNVQLHQRLVADSKDHIRVFSYFTNTTRGRLLDNKSRPIKEECEPLFKRAADKIREHSELLRGKKILLCSHKPIVTAVKKGTLPLGELGEVTQELGIQVTWLYWSQEKGKNCFKDYTAAFSLGDPFPDAETFSEGQLHAAKSLYQLFGRLRPADATEIKLMVAIGITIPQFWTQEGTLFEHIKPGRALASNALVPVLESWHDDLEYLIAQYSVRWVRDNLKINGINLPAYRDKTKQPTPKLAQAIVDLAAQHKASSVVINSQKDTSPILIVIDDHVSRYDTPNLSPEKGTPRLTPNDKPTLEEVYRLMFPDDCPTDHQKYLDDWAESQKYKRPRWIPKTDTPTIQQEIEAIRQRYQVAV